MLIKLPLVIMLWGHKSTQDKWDLCCHRVYILDTQLRGWNHKSAFGKLLLISMTEVMRMDGALDLGSRKSCSLFNLSYLRFDIMIVIVI